MQCATCVIRLFSPTITDSDHPENQNCEERGSGSERGNIYPLLLIASLITLRPLQLEEGNLGSASSSLPTVAPENTLGGVDLPPPRPSGILRLRWYVSDLGVSIMLRGPWSHRTRGMAQSDEPLGLSLSPKLLICREVLQTPA